MKKFTLFFSILFLFVFATKAFAADVKLVDNSTLNEKLITVSIDTQEQTTENVKIVLNFSPEITITKINESELNCSTFSSVFTGGSAEITCALSSSQKINGKFAEIIFTTTAEKYAFVIDKNQSKIGELTIDNVVDLGQLNAEGTNTDTTNGTDGETTETSEGNQPAKTQTPAPTTQKKTTGFMSFLPYILLGAAGIFLIAIIVLLITKKRDDITPNTIQTMTQTLQQPVVPSLINPQPQEATQYQVNSVQESAPTVEEKPTLGQLVSQSPEVSNFATPETSIMPTPQTVRPQQEELSDLEALLVSENPSLNTVPQETIVETPAVTNSQPEYQTGQNLPPIENIDINSGYTANTSTGGLPEVGSTSPLEPSYQVSPDLGPIEQPITEPVIADVPVVDIATSNPIPEVNPIGMSMDTTEGFPINNAFPPVNTEPSPVQPVENNTADVNTTGLEVDLQSIINQEISSIPLNPTQVNTEPQNPVTPMNPTNTIEPVNPI